MLWQLPTIPRLPSPTSVCCTASLFLGAPELGVNPTACEVPPTDGWTRCSIRVAGAHGGPTSEQQSKFLFGLATQGEVFVDDAALVAA